MPFPGSRLALLAPVFTAALSAGACVDISAGNANYVDTVEKRFTVTSTPTVKLGTFDGGVDVRTWDRQEVLVEIEKRAMDKDDADRMRVTAAQDGDRITVEVRDEHDGDLHFRWGSHSARVSVTVPAATQVEARTGDGRIVVRDVSGDISARTGDGAIHLENVSGSVDVSSGDGSIDIDGALTRLNARSGDGRVIVHASAANAAREDWHIVTGDGSVTLEVPDGFAADLDATTGDGRVEVRDVPFSGSRESRRRGSAHGRIGDGGPQVTIHTGDGSIVIRNRSRS
jgi:DUF4097 and DUF4098 domain-containing protein YvlB